MPPVLAADAAISTAGERVLRKKQQAKREKVIALLLLTAIVAAEPSQWSGLFDPSGSRMESVPVIEPLDSKEKLRARCKSIKGWSDQAGTARSVAFREVAANALMQMAVGHSEKRLTLTDEELKQCRDAAVKLLKAKEPIPRQYGTWALKEIGDAECTKPLVACLKDSEITVRFGAAEALGEHGDDTAVAPLFAAAKDGNPDTALPEKSIAALGRIGTPAAKAALERLLVGAKDELVRERILEAIDAIEKK